MTRRTIDELGDLLELPYCAVLATWREDGSALLSPVWHEWRDGGFNIGVPEGDIKLRHLARDPRATVVVYDHAWPSRGFEVSGIAQIRSDLRAEVSRRLSIRYLGPAVGVEYADRVGPGVIVRVEPGRMRAWDFVDEVRAEPGFGILTPAARTQSRR
ncbi:MAG TPA: pyridoxamine 5'-phosphate oxidase family protein [Candidatus Saccharimonadales bacterium]|nr:pyridoxamine 5'-phosphate oxidase family protein [Candidatus Saccharimonadales bacterium]